MFTRYKHWERASPWLVGANPRDLVMPVDGDDGFFPTSGNEMVGINLAIGSCRAYQIMTVDLIFTETRSCDL